MAIQQRQRKNETPHTLVGSVSRVMFYAPDTGYFVVALTGESGPEQTLTGYSPVGKPAVGVRWEASGHYTRHPKHGEQFAVERFVEQIPDDVAGLRGYLSSGAVAGVGRVTAAALIDAFGADVLHVIETQPERLTEVAGVGAKKAKRIREGWERSRAVQEIMVFLSSIGIGPALSARVYRHFGSGRAGALIEHLKANPYRLSRVRGIGFPTADGCALRMGVGHGSDYRITAGVEHVMGEAIKQGHTLCPMDVLAERSVDLLKVDPTAVSRCIKIALERGDLVDGQLDGVRAVTLPKVQAAERRIADWFSRRMDPGFYRKRMPYADAIHALAASTSGLSESQTQALLRISDTPVCVLTGGPGTGKTTLLRAVIHAAEGCRVEDRGVRVIACAPTGRAAKRIEEATGSRAATIHRTLEFDPKNGGFARCASNPLEADFVVVDESSMNDVFLFDALIDATPPQAGLLIVGDADQLPSVGPGNVLSDLIGSEVVPVARLTEIFRQARGSGIAMAARRVLDGRMPAYGPDIGFEEVGGDDDWRAVVRRVESLIQAGIPSNEIQVLSPMKRGSLGCERLNEVLREALNPKVAQAEIAYGRTVFREGDRVMQCRNNYELDVMNGDIGRIERIHRNSEDETEILVRFDERGVRMSREDLDDLAPAYAITIHKSQGGEYRAVVMALNYGHYTMLNRNLIYTGITRAKQSLSLIGQSYALAYAVHDESKARARWTALGQFLRENRGKPETGDADAFHLDFTACGPS